jgi:hypothetical protein
MDERPAPAGSPSPDPRPPVMMAADAATGLNPVDSAAVRGYVSRTGDRRPRTRQEWADLARLERARPIAQE